MTEHQTGYKTVYGCICYLTIQRTQLYVKDGSSDEPRRRTLKTSTSSYVKWILRIFNLNFKSHKFIIWSTLFICTIILCITSKSFPSTTISPTHSPVPIVAFLSSAPAECSPLPAPLELSPPPAPSFRPPSPNFPLTRKSEHYVLPDHTCCRQLGIYLGPT